MPPGPLFRPAREHAAHRLTRPADTCRSATPQVRLNVLRSRRGQHWEVVQR